MVHSCCLATNSRRRWNRRGSACVQVRVGKKLAIALCVLALTGCAQTVAGTAVGEDSWQGQGVTRSQTPSTSPSFSTSRPLPSTPATRPSGFDPCAIEDFQLEIFFGVDPETRTSVAGGEGCLWSGEDQWFSAFGIDVNREALATVPGVTGLGEFESHGQTVHRYVIDGASCVTVAEIDGQSVQFVMVEHEFDSRCFELEVGTRSMLGVA